MSVLSVMKQGKFQYGYHGMVSRVYKTIWSEEVTRGKKKKWSLKKLDKSKSPIGF